MCRILESIIRNYKQNLHHSEEQEYNNRTLAEIDEKNAFDREVVEPEVLSNGT